MNQTSTGIKVAAVDDIEIGAGLAIDKAITGTDDDVALLRDDDGTVYALDDTCSHETASLSEGWVEDGHVECPLHSSRFCLANGEVQGLPATRDVRCHRVEIRDGHVYLFPGEVPAS